ncbi:MAG TPA: LysR family transcriptional regulator [Burkholderiales bacterium]
MIELRQLRHFVAVAEELNFRRASLRLHMSQPPLSVSIQHLEAEVGAPLLDRSRHHVRLTPAGALFLKDARRILAQAQQAVERARRAAGGMEGSLKISFVPSAALELLPALFKRFQREYPTVHLQLSADTTVRQLEALNKGDVDLAIVVGPLSDTKGLRVETLGEQRFVLAVPRGHALAERKSVRLRELAAEAFVAFPASEGPGFYAALLHACQAAGFHPKVVQQASQMQVILTLVAGGAGVALVPASMQVMKMGDVKFLELADPKPPTYGLEFAHAADADNPVIEAFLATARRTLMLPAKPRAASGRAAKQKRVRRA